MSRRPDMGIFDVGTCPQTSERSFKDVPDTDNTVAYVSGHSIYDPLLCFTRCFTTASLSVSQDLFRCVHDS